MQNFTSHKRLYINMTAFANKRQNIKLKLQRGLLKKNCSPRRSGVIKSTDFLNVFTPTNKSGNTIKHLSRI